MSKETLPSPPEPGAGVWAAVPSDGLPHFEPQALPAQWQSLHAGQCLALPANPALVRGWALYHGGDFEGAAAIGLAEGGEGMALANRATAIYANYVEPSEAMRLALFRQVAQRADAQAQAEPGNVHALYWHAYALGRYGQGISVARALAQGLGGKVKGALERVLALQPHHADAHLALGAFHAEVIDKVGPLVGRMTYGVRVELAVDHFERGLELNPHSPSGMMEYAQGLLMLYGDACEQRAHQLYAQAAAHSPRDARERLDVELARAGLVE